MHTLAQTRDRLFKAVRSFHENEEGLETLQVVIIVAVAAVIVIALAVLYQQVVKPYAQTETTNVTKFKSGTQAGTN
jgi:hypothetical protein